MLFNAVKWKLEPDRLRLLALDSVLFILPSRMTQYVETNGDINRDSVQKRITQVKIEIQNNFSSANRNAAGNSAEKFILHEIQDLQMRLAVGCTSGCDKSNR